MKRISAEADRAVARVLRRQAGLITRSQALTAGLTEGALRYKIRPGGRWQTVLPGVYQNHNGPLAAGQREIAAVLYAGDRGVITGLAALRTAGVRAPASEVIDVLIPQESKRQSTGFVRTHRTQRLPEEPVLSGGLRWAPVPRAVADTARIGLEFSQVRELAAAAVQSRRCSVGDLTAELRAGPRRGAGALKTVLAEVADGVASGAEGDLRKLVRSGRLPEPLYNPDLYLGSAFLGRPDLWWKDAWVAGELDSREWHLSPAQWQRTMERHAKLSAAGIIVLHFSPQQVRTEGQRVLAELRSAIDAGRRRSPLPVRTVPRHR
jgi:hypothetical protein